MSKRQFAPAAARNRDPILNVLSDLIPDTADILEIASGTGEHAIHFAKSNQNWSIQPSDINSIARDSIDAWVHHENLSNVFPAVALDAMANSWPFKDKFDAILCINMIHISPEGATMGLMHHSFSALRSEGRLVLYGPYKINGKHTAESNAAFDLSLRERNPSWGVRDLDWVKGLAHNSGFEFQNIFDMPANNKILSFQKL